MVELNKVARFEIAKMCCSEDLAFRVRSRRNNLLGLWAAARLGMTGAAADAYAKWVVSAGIDHPDDADLARRIVKNAAASGAALEEKAVRAEIDRLSQIASLEFGAVPGETRFAA